MPTEELYVIPQRQQLGVNGIEQRGMVAIGEIGAANAAAEENIAAEYDDRPFANHEDHVAPRMAGNVENLEGDASIQQFVEWFPGVTLEQARTVLDHAARSALAPA